MQGDLSKWLKIGQELNYWDSQKAKAIQQKEAEIISHWLKGLNLPSLDILEVGCGNGFLGKLIIQDLIKQKKKFSYCFTDLIPECLNKTKVTLGRFGKLPQVSCEQLDVYQIDKKLEKESQQIIISTGFAAAATYKQAVPKVARVLQRGGILICDFVNHFSPAVWLPQPLSVVKLLLKFRKESQDPAGKRYHIGRIGIKECFKKFGLTIGDMTSVGWRRNPLLVLFTKQ